MIKQILILMTTFLALTVLHASNAPKDKVSMFPKAEDGYVQYVIDVPKTENDYDHKIELLIGKTILTDCNQRSFFGTIKEVELKGWGYTYLEVNDIRDGVTTMMACKEPKEEKFVSLYAPKETLRRYNSRLPLVVYVPEGYEVKYRIWNASEGVEEAVKR